MASNDQPNSTSSIDINKILSTINKKEKDNGPKEHKFWDTQPVPKLDENVTEYGPLESKNVKDVQKEPYTLPSGYEWYICDMNEEKNVEDVYNLLNQNYVEDDDATFRFDYSRNFLKWALMPPGYVKDWHLAVRSSANQKLYGFISGIPADMSVSNTQIHMVEINFLCVHKKLRSKRLGPVLIKEITRRVNLRDIWQAVYTAGVVLPKPVSKNRYWHRSLNPKKLIEIGFSRLPPKMTLTSTIRLYKMPAEPKAAFRKMQLTDVASATKLLNTYLSRFTLHPVFTEKDVAHWINPHENVVSSYVLEGKNGEITDLISFYELPSSILKNPKHNLLKAAYSFYQVATTVNISDVFYDALVFAQAEGFDVFNALDVMDNNQVFKELKFGIGDGNLQYYLYNWKCPTMLPNENGLVLL